MRDQVISYHIIGDIYFCNKNEKDAGQVKVTTLHNPQRSSKRKSQACPSPWQETQSLIYLSRPAQSPKILSLIQPSSAGPGVASGDPAN